MHRGSLAVGFLLGMGFLMAIIVLQQGTVSQQTAPKSAQAPTTLQKFKASGYLATSDTYFLIIDAGKDKGIWTKYGLDPEFVFIPGRPVDATDLKDQVSSGVRIGLSSATDPPLARSYGTMIKVVAGYAGACTPCRLFVSGDSPIKNIKDLDGKKIGVVTKDNWSYRFLIYLSNKYGLKLEAVPLGNITNNVVALKLGKIDGFIHGSVTPIRLVDSGELRILLSLADVGPKPWAAGTVWATDDLIQQDPELVRRFVKATLETVKYLKENPSYAAELYMKKANAPKDLAEKFVSQIDWRPSGHGAGESLVAALLNVWEYNKEVGAIPANIDVKFEDVVDARFLP